MCVIIVRNKDVVIPSSKIESACHVNSDGWGMSIVDRGKIETIKDYNAKGNDPDIVNEMLEKTKGHKVYLHLRFATRGAKNEANCHPFKILKTDDYELMLMHNGTFSDFGSDKMTDSEEFGLKVVAPLVERTRFVTDKALDDEYVKMIIKKYAGSYSRVVLYDNEGNDLIHGDSSESKWHDENGWWSSNVYSFNRTHRDSKGSSYYDRGAEYYKGWQAGGKKEEPPFTRTTPNASLVGVTLPQTNTTTANGAISKENMSMQTEVTETVSAGFPKRDPVDPEPVVSFCDIAGFHHLHEVVDLTDEHLMELLDDKDIALALLRDLIYELYLKEEFGE